MLLPFGAWGMDGSPRLARDGSPKLAMDTAGNLLPLPPIPYLDSMRWMNWKPSTPIFKVDTLLLPDSARPGLFRMPTEYDRGLPRVS
ncbi:hypothetical protein RN69_09950 [Bradyrhizobium japonicum]|nr:hypothetical protein RN69_09950 [Bradyrhizobium japonicum]